MEKPLQSGGEDVPSKMKRHDSLAGGFAKRTGQLMLMDYQAPTWKTATSPIF
jgi:hypothetical protein